MLVDVDKFVSVRELEEKYCILCAGRLFPDTHRDRCQKCILGEFLRDINVGMYHIVKIKETK